MRGQGTGAIESLGKRFKRGEYNLRGGNCSIEARKRERLWKNIGYWAQ